MKRFLKVTLIGCTLLLIAWLLVTAIHDRQDSAATIGIRTPNPIVGIWKGQHGVILDLRADGTARSRSIDDKTNIQYFKYRLRGEEFSVLYSAKPSEYLQRLRHAIFGMSADNYELSKLSNSELQLTDLATGDTFVFSRAEDPVLAAAP